MTKRILSITLLAAVALCVGIASIVSPVQAKPKPWCETTGCPPEVQEETSAARGAVEAAAETAGEKKADAVLWISAVVACLSLLTCIVLPLWVYFAPGADYGRRLEFFKGILLYPTLIYFVTGTVWAIKRGKED